MPPRVASPQQAEAAKAGVAGYADVKTGQGGGMNKFSRTRPLTKFEREALASPINTVYVYNISPIFKWQKDYPGLGSMTLHPRPEDKEYSDPIVLEKRLVRSFDGGNRIQRLMVEMPLDIVQDFLVCSPEYPGRPENNLTTYGCFYTVSIPIEEMKDRQLILDDAELKHRNRLHEKVASADALVNSPFRVCIGEVHRKAALYLHSKGDIAELPDWVSRRAKLNTTDECRFCGFENKRAVVKCRNCHEILDQEAYDKLKGETKKK